MEFEGKVILITGASSAIGTAVAFYFASRGAKLSLCGINEETLNKTAERCELVGKVKPLVVTSDLTNADDTTNLIRATITYFLTIDVLVNNAGILETGSIETTTLEQFDRIFNLNVRSAYHLTMLAVPYLIQSEGVIVNVSSVNGLKAFPGLLAYNMSKAAVDQFTRCLAIELSDYRIRVNSVNVGIVVTDLEKGITDKLDESYLLFLRRSKETHPLGRAGFPEEIARAIAFLASDKASFVTGVNLPVDGGRHATSLR
ncbi:3-oxoacyl-[acyl-carrier-protein] reductase FabG-like [Lycorma delicatula]|uniref:3-oxoacyl-[acyl-carrier-protein] reductase FabG-like n=1 Tax=Lycorma delicatula TaxID=130591 RepID=UPI003F50E43A